MHIFYNPRTNIIYTIWYSRPNNDGKYHPELDNVFDPTEDRGYDFAFQSPDQVKEEHANSIGDVQGRYDNGWIKFILSYIIDTPFYNVVFKLQVLPDVDFSQMEMI